MFNIHWKNLHMSQQKCNTPSTNMHKLKQKNQLQQTKKTITATNFNNDAFNSNFNLGAIIPSCNRNFESKNLFSKNKPWTNLQIAMFQCSINQF